MREEGEEDVNMGARAFGAVAFMAALVSVPNAGADDWRSRRISLEIVSAPNIAYSGEKTSLSFRVKNNGYFTARLSCRQLARVAGAVAFSERRRLEIKGRREAALLTPLDMKTFKNKRGIIEISLHRVGSGDKEIARRRIVVRPSDADLADVTVRLGHFENKNGDRVIFCTDWEDPATYRRWAWAKWLRGRSSRSNRNILLYGDRMDTGFDDSMSYVGILADRVREKSGKLTFVHRASGPSPILSDILEIDSLVRNVHPTPDVFILSFGLADIRKSTPKSDYARAMDMIIDRVRLHTSRSQRIVLVSPPPLVSQVELSSSYRDAALKVARDHHVGFVDLHRLMCGIDGEASEWKGSYYTGSRRGKTAGALAGKAARGDVFYLYPNALGQKLIAEAIIAEVF